MESPLSRNVLAGAVARFRRIKRERGPFIGQGALLALGLLTVAVLAAIFHTTFPHVGYVNTLTSSGGILADENKLRDVLLVPFAIAVQLCVIAWSLRDNENPARASDGAATVITRLTFPVLVVVIAMTGGVPALVLLAVPALAAFVAHKISPDRWQTVFGYSIVPSAVTGFAVGHAAGLPPFIGFAFGLIALQPVLAANTGRRRWVAAVAALGLIGILVWALPALSLPDVSRNASIVLNGIFAITILAACVAAFKQERRWREPDIKTDAPPSVLLIALALSVLTLSGPPGLFLPEDDYHFGEQLLASQAIQTGVRFFVDFLSPHGWIDGVGAFWQMLADDRSPQGMMFGLWMVSAAVQFGAIFLFVRVLGPFLGVLLALAAPESQNLLIASVLMYGIAVCGWSRHSLIAGAASTAGSAAAVFLLAGTGVASAVAAYAGAVVLQARFGLGAVARFGLGSFIAASVLGVSMMEQIKGQMLFLLVSAGANLSIYGNGSLLKPMLPALVFAVLPLILFYLLRADARAGQGHGSRIWWVAFVAPIVIAVLLVSGYAMGRLDNTGARAIWTSQVLVPFALLWFALVRHAFSDRLGGLAASRLCVAGGLLVSTLTALSWSPPLGRSALIAPAFAWGQNASDVFPIAPASGARLGRGSSDPTHVARIEAAAAVARANLGDGETFVDLTNRNAFYYYLNRSVPAPISSAYNAAPDVFQQAFVDAVRNERPALALVEVDSVNHDGLSLPLRSHSIYKLLLRAYRPFASGKYIYAVRADRPVPAGSLDATFSPVAASDANWSKGIAVGPIADQWTFLAPGVAMAGLRAGDDLSFSDGVVRKVVTLRWNFVRTEPGIAAGEAEPPTFKLVPRVLTDSELWAAAFRVPDLLMLPSAWGRSMARLAPRLDTRVVGLRRSEAVAQNGAQWDFAPESGFSPMDTGLLNLRLNCPRPKGLARVQVSWRSEGEAFNEARSVWFSLNYPEALVPLDIAPLWSLSPSIAGIRVALVNPDVCEGAEMSNVRLLSRIGSEVRP